MGAETKNQPKPEPIRRLELEDQSRMRLDGVRELLRLEENLVVLRRGDRLLVIRGEGLRLRQLEPMEGRVELRGRVDSLSFERPGPEKGLLRRIFG